MTRKPQCYSNSLIVIHVVIMIFNVHVIIIYYTDFEGNSNSDMICKVIVIEIYYTTFGSISNSNILIFKVIVIVIFYTTFGGISRF